MIISKKRNFIYFAVPKTATHSVRQALNQSRVDGDWEQQVLFAKQGEQRQSIPIPAVAKIVHGHISVAQIRPHLEESFWNTAFKFAFVRNPYSRFLSVCTFLNRRNDWFADNALQWMKSAIKEPRFQQRILVRPQFEMLSDLDGKFALDFIGRYETLQTDMDQICKILGEPNVELGWKNQTPRLQQSIDYDDELRQLVADFYKVDFDQFDYST